MKQSNLSGTYAPSKFRNEKPRTIAVHVGEAIRAGLLKESKSKLLLHGHYDTDENGEPDFTTTTRDVNIRRQAPTENK